MELLVCFSLRLGTCSVRESNGCHGEGKSPTVLLVGASNSIELGVGEGHLKLNRLAAVFFLWLCWLV